MSQVYTKECVFWLLDSECVCRAGQIIIQAELLLFCLYDYTYKYIHMCSIKRMKSLSLPARTFAILKCVVAFFFIFNSIHSLTVFYILLHYVHSISSLHSLRCPIVRELNPIWSTTI